VVALLALAMMASAFRFTAAPGPGLDPDAMSYLGAAQSFAAHGTLRVPMAPWMSDSTSERLSHFPPGYPLVLSMPVALGDSAVHAARVVQAVAAGATIAVCALTLWPVAGAWGAVLGAVALALVPAFIFVQLSVLSEPLYLALLMLVLWSLVRHPRAALLHGVLAAAAMLVRYAGLSVAAAAALWALRDTASTWRERLRRAALAVAPSLAAMLAWALTRDHSSGTGEPIREFAVYGDWGPTLREGAQTVAHQLAPSLEWEPTPWLAAAATIVALAALVWSTVRAQGEVLPAPERDDPRWATQREVIVAAGCLALAYLALIVASRALADPAIPFDFRLAAPLAPLVVTVVAVIGARAWRVISRPARVFGVLAVCAWMAAAVRANHQQVSDALADGGDFAGSDWRDSPTLAWVSAQDPSRAIFTNLPCEIWFHLQRNVRSLPFSIVPDTMHAFVARLRESGGAMVAWNLQSPETAHTDSIVARAGLVRIATFADGNVYQARPLVAAPSASAVRLPVAAPPARR
jgi:4-amino-4-deoxy-L-arabinose transferase-like glycosyltransferase